MVIVTPSRGQIIVCVIRGKLLSDVTLVLEFRTVREENVKMIIIVLVFRFYILDNIRFSTQSYLNTRNNSIFFLLFTHIVSRIMSRENKLLLSFFAGLQFYSASKKHISIKKIKKN